MIFIRVSAVASRVTDGFAKHLVGLWQIEKLVTDGCLDFFRGVSELGILGSVAKGSNAPSLKEAQLKTKGCFIKIGIIGCLVKNAFPAVM